MNRNVKDSTDKMISLIKRLGGEPLNYTPKVNQMYNTLKEYNPFADKNGNVFNKYIDYQSVLNNPNVSKKAKEFIAKSTGLSENLPQYITQNNTYTGIENTEEQNKIPETVPGKLGFISAKYETGGYNPGAVSAGEGDYGGVSYGIPQFSTKTGSADNFVKWLKNTNPKIGGFFGNTKAGTSEFSGAWEKAYSEFGDVFANAQTDYAYNSFVKPLADLAKNKTGIDYERSPALKELIYSTAIQFGGGSLGLAALGNVSSDMSDKDIINTSYDEKISNYKNFFKSSSSNVQESVKKRFANERNDVLGLI